MKATTINEKAHQSMSSSSKGPADQNNLLGGESLYLGAEPAVPGLRGALSAHPIFSTSGTSSRMTRSSWSTAQPHRYSRLACPGPAPDHPVKEASIQAEALIPRHLQRNSSACTTKRRPAPPFEDSQGSRRNPVSTNGDRPTDRSRKDFRPPVPDWEGYTAIITSKAVAGPSAAESRRHRVDRVRCISKLLYAEAGIGLVHQRHAEEGQVIFELARHR